jgi:hypothetical protein
LRVRSSICHRSSFGPNSIREQLAAHEQRDCRDPYRCRKDPPDVADCSDGQREPNVEHPGEDRDGDGGAGKRDMLQRRSASRSITAKASVIAATNAQ